MILTKGIFKIKNIIFMASTLMFIMFFHISITFAASEETYLAPLTGSGYNSTGSEVYDYNQTDAAYYGNANKTGIADLTKEGLERLSRAVPGQRVHGSYMADTNSCASCHITHSAAGEKLLFRNSVYNSCSSCHDGTMGIYNVFSNPDSLKNQLEAVIKSDKSGKAERFFAIGGGTFAGLPDMGTSVHLSNGSLNLTTAPGGNRNAVSGSWTAEFTCASCHAPHGSYSSRLLHYNPNNVGITPVTEGGLLKENIDLVPASQEDKAVLSISDEHFPRAYVAKEKSILVTDPWLYLENSVIVKDSAGDLKTDDFEIIYGKSYAVFKEMTPAVSYTITLAPAINAKFSFSVEADGSKRVTNYGDITKLNDFCGACHTDYNTGRPQANAGVEETSVSVGRGTFTRGSRHNMKGNGCLECHFAHGTTKDIQMDAVYNVGLYKDINLSSALKRYVNMSVCWNCHVQQKATTFRNDLEFYNDPRGGEFVSQNR